MDMHGKFKFSDSSLMAIINNTDDKIHKMDYLNRQVQAMSEALPVVNNSTSGQKLAARIADWNGDFNQVMDQLKGLNKDAQDLLNVNRRTSTETTQRS